MPDLQCITKPDMLRAESLSFTFVAGITLVAVQKLLTAIN